MAQEKMAQEKMREAMVILLCNTPDPVRRRAETYSRGETSRRTRSICTTFRFKPLDGFAEASPRYCCHMASCRILALYGVPNLCCPCFLGIPLGQVLHNESNGIVRLFDKQPLDDLNEKASGRRVQNEEGYARTAIKLLREKTSRSTPTYEMCP